MLNIDENDLCILIKEERKKYIERPKLYGLGEVLSGISLLITILLGDYSQIPFSEYFKFFFLILSLVVLGYGILITVKNLKDKFNTDDLYNEILELDSHKEHAFNIVLVKSNKNDGKYLLYLNRRWKCYHFISYKVQNAKPYDCVSEQKRIQESLKTDIGLADKEMKIIYINDFISRKYSVGDHFIKKFHFYFYEVTTSHQFPQSRFFNKQSSFYNNGKKYRWYTIDQMNKIPSIKKTNLDVLDHVRNNCSIS